MDVDHVEEAKERSMSFSVEAIRQCNPGMTGNKHPLFRLGVIAASAAHLLGGLKRPDEIKQAPTGPMPLQDERSPVDGGFSTEIHVEFRDLKTRVSDDLGAVSKAAKDTAQTATQKIQDAASPQAGSLPSSVG